MSLIRCIIRFNPSFSSFKILTKFTLNANSLNPPAASKQISNQVSKNKVSSNSIGMSRIWKTKSRWLRKAGDELWNEKSVSKNPSNIKIPEVESFTPRQRGLTRMSTLYRDPIGTRKQHGGCPWMKGLAEDVKERTRGKENLGEIWKGNRKGDERDGAEVWDAFSKDFIGS